MQTLPRAAVAAILLFALTPAGVLAHARLVASVPAEGEVITALPSEFALTFSEPLTDGSSVMIVDGPGATVATSTVAVADHSSMRGPLAVLSNGTYEIRWTAVTDDGDIERGHFTFIVAIEGATPGPTPAGAGGGSGGGPELPEGILFVGALVLIGSGIAWRLRRRMSS